MRDEMSDLSNLRRLWFPVITLGVEESAILTNLDPNLVIRDQDL